MSVSFACFYDVVYCDLFPVPGPVPPDSSDRFYRLMILGDRSCSLMSSGSAECNLVYSYLSLYSSMQLGSKKPIFI